MRINKFISSSGYASRRKADDLIQKGKVKLNGEVLTELGTQVDPSVDRIEIGGKILSVDNDFRYYAFYKPVGIVSTHRVFDGEENIFSYLREKRFSLERMKIAGRLDKNSEGLMILSNDGDLIYHLTHPSSEVTKVYEVGLYGVYGEKEQRKILKGVQDHGEMLVVDAFRIMTQKDGDTVIQITLHEGKKRHIRRMFSQLHLHVHNLKRLQIDNIELGSMNPGNLRKLTKSEVISLLEYRNGNL